MAVITDDILECAARLETQEGDDVIGAFQFRYLGIPALTDQQGIDDVIEFLEAVYGLLRVLIPILSVFRDITVRNQTQAINYGTFPWVTFANGLAGGDDLPPGVALLVSFSTGISHLNLRKYFGNIAEGGVSQPGRWLPTTVAPAVAAAAVMLVPFVATNGSWEYGYNSPVALDWVVPVSAIVTDVPSYQRRRRQGRGS